MIAYHFRQTDREVLSACTNRVCAYMYAQFIQTLQKQQKSQELYFSEAVADLGKSRGVATADHNHISDG